MLGAWPFARRRSTRATNPHVPANADTGTGNAVPVHNVKSNILGLIVEYCQYHVNATKEKDGKKPTDDEIKAWDTQFVNVEQVVLFELILAATYMNIKALLDLTCLTVAEMIKGKTPEEIRKTFNIKVRVPPSGATRIPREAVSGVLTRRATLPRARPNVRHGSQYSGAYSG